MVRSYGRGHGWDDGRLARFWFRVKVLCGNWASLECDLGYGFVCGLGLADWVVG